MRNETTCTALDTSATLDDGARPDWSASIRLAIVVSVFAALSSMLLAGYVSEVTIVVLVIVGGTMASWYQLEHPVAARATVRDAVRRHP